MPMLSQPMGFGRPPATGVPAGLAQPEIFLAEQQQRPSWWRQEHVLWATVLHTAAIEAQWSDYKRRHDDQHTSPRELARTWVEQRGEYLGGFVWVCHTLHLDPEAVAYEILVRGRIGTFGEIRTFHRNASLRPSVKGQGPVGRAGSAWSSGNNWATRATKQRRHR